MSDFSLLLLNLPANMIFEEFYIRLERFLEDSLFNMEKIKEKGKKAANHSKDGQQSEQIINIEQPIKKFIGFITIVSFITAILYLTAYWTAFGIDVFEFIDISNIVVHSFVPLQVGFFYMILTIGYLILSDLDFGILLRLIIFVFFILLLILLFIILCLSSAILFYFLLLLIPPTLAYWGMRGLMYKNFGGRFIPDPIIRILLYFFVIFLPLAGGAYGRIKAGLIKNGHYYLYVDGTSFNEEVRKLGDDKIRYIGTMGDYFFFLLPSDKSTYIVKKEEIKPFVLKRYNILNDRPPSNDIS